MTPIREILALLEDADRRLTKAYALCPLDSREKPMVGAIMVPLFDCIQEVKQLQAEIERAERRKYQP